MKTCIIDNFDSFTFNLVDLVARVSGQLPRVVKNNEMTANDIVMAGYDSIIISPGPGTVENKQDIGVCLDIIANSARPLLGVCLGHQAIAYHYGGRRAGIIKIGAPTHGKATKIFHDGTGIFDGLPNPLMVGRYHSLVVEEAALAKELRVVARDEDGNIMAIAHRTKPIYGLQFHPESILTAGGKKMMENFFALSSRWSSALPSILPMDDNNAGNIARQPAVADAVVAKVADAVVAKVITGQVTPPATSPKKRIICQEWTTDLSMAAIVASCFLPHGAPHGSPHGATMWLDGDDKTGWGRGGFSYIGGTSKKDMQKGTIMAKDLSSASDVFFNNLAQARQDFLLDDETMSVIPADIAGAGFFGGPMGFLSYEGRVLCPDAFTNPPSTSHAAATPDGFFILADRLVIENKTNGKKYLLAVGQVSDTYEMEKWIEDMKAMGAMGAMKETNNADDNDMQKKISRDATKHTNWRFDKSKEDYIANIAAAIAAIKRGEAYQLCLTNQLTATFSSNNSLSPFSLYQHLRADNNTPYRGFLAMPAVGSWAVLCFSPEEFLQLSPSGKITTKPIKGTARRGKTASEDEALAQQLLLSEKNRAENIMIVDLLRNDMTRVAAPGSIMVEKTCALETFDKVHQLVSTVTAQLLPDKDIVDLLRASFPGGSMTGAPKIRAMELIEKMEARRRGVYSGVFGYVSAATSLAMVIRTLVVEHNNNDWHYSLGVGSGIVVDSNPAEEWQELLWKAAGIIDSLKKIMTVTIEE